MSGNRKSYPLVDTTEPNLLEETFDYGMPPLIRFDGPVVEYVDGRPIEFDPQALKTRDIFITDTTFRDGQQARPPYTIDQMVRIYDLLGQLGGPNGVIRQTEFFLYTHNDRETLDRCRELGHSYPECTGWIRAVPGDFRLVKEAGLAESGMLTSCSDYHIFEKLKFKSRQQCMDAYCEVVDAAFEAGVRPRCHLEDITRADIEGFVLPFVERLMRMSEQVPDEKSVKIRLCDTMGFGVSFPGAELPRSVPKLVYKLNQEVGVPSSRLEWHGHNDFHKVHINGATAWLYGCDAVNATLFGIGERTGNPPLESAVFEYIALKGDLCGIRTEVISELADYMRSIGLPIPDNYPFVGKAFNTTRAGIHAGGLRQDERIYNIFDTAALLNRPPRVALTDKTGSDGVALWVNEYFGLKGSERISKIKCHKVARWVMDQYEKEGRMTTISDEELEQKVQELMPEYYRKYKGDA
ncbi:MAG: 2-isopropylmalate synthase [Rhodopirellula sp.]|nr:2-isopropylmalate synthase [Rhodopirellula sp.]